jgi:FSR family fosmidomycin resistance protein-like MFS transporter
MSLLFDSLFSSVALGHLIVDILNGQRAVLITYLSGPLGLSNAALGLFSTIYVVAGSLTQPVFGYFADRLGPRWTAAGGILWMAIFFSLALITPGQAALWLLILASFGSSAFHPAGVMQATLRGRTHFSGRETTSAAYFFVFGQAGLFFGPFIGGPILDRFGPMGLLIFPFLALPVGINAAQQLRKTISAVQFNVTALSSGVAALQVPGGASLRVEPISKPSFDPGRSQLHKMTKTKLLLLVAFALLAAFQAWSQQNMITFVPKYLSDLGQSAGTYGVIAALFMGGSAVGNAVGGSLADRYGKRRVASIALVSASVPLYLVATVGLSPWLYLLVPLGGALTGATHSIIVVLAQRMIPSGMATASGLILGFMFSSGAVGTFLSGLLADAWGLIPVFHLTAGIALAAGFLAMLLREPSVT